MGWYSAAASAAERVYYWQNDREWIFLLLIYRKGAKDDNTPKEEAISYYFKGYNSPDGKISATSEKGGKTYQSIGIWQIKGNTVCVNWNNKDWKPGCGTYTKNGESYFVKSTASSSPSIPAAKVVDGNPPNL